MTRLPGAFCKKTLNLVCRALQLLFIVSLMRGIDRHCSLTRWGIFPAQQRNAREGTGFTWVLQSCLMQVSVLSSAGEATSALGRQSDVKDLR